MKNYIPKLLEMGGIVDGYITYPRGRRKLTPEELGIPAEKFPEEFTTGQKKMLPEEWIKKFMSVEIRFNALIRKHSYSFPHGSTKFSPSGLIPKMREGYEKLKEEFEQLRDEFAAVYPEIRPAMIERFRKNAEDAYDRLTAQKAVIASGMTKEEFATMIVSGIEKLYPADDAIAGEFHIELMVDTTCSDLSDIYQNEARERAAQFAESVVASLRQGAKEFFDKMKKKIDKGEVIKSESKAAILKVLDNISAANFIDDPVIRNGERELRQVLGDGARAATDIKEQVSEIMGTLSKQCEEIRDNVVVRKFTRTVEMLGEEKEV